MISTFPIGSKLRTGDDREGIEDDPTQEWREFVGNPWHHGNRNAASDVELPQRGCLKFETLDETFALRSHA